MAKYRCAILDDYQNVALQVADWSKVSGDLDIKVFNEHLGGPDNVVKALQGFQIVCAMRERTGFPRRRDREAARPEAPDHHRHAQRLDRHGAPPPTRASPSAAPDPSAARPPASPSA